LSPAKTDITYIVGCDASPEGELSALVSVYCFVLDCHSQKKGGPTTAPDEGERSLDEFASTQNLTRQAGRAWPGA
jgi:hypothetical protein